MEGPARVVRQEEQLRWLTSVAGGALLCSCAVDHQIAPNVQGATTIAFVRADNGVHHIYTAQPDGSNLLQLTNTANSDDYPSWAPDGSALVFSRRLITGSAVIDRINPDGSGLAPVSQETVPTDVQPSWGQNNQILYVRFIPFAPVPMSQLMIMQADGSNPTVIYPPAPDGFLYLEPHLNPADGQTVVFAGTGDGISGSDQIWTVRIDGSGLQQLTFNQSGTVSGDPSWINGGKGILFTHRDQAGNVNLWSMNADGSNQTQITPFVEPNEGGDGDLSLTGSLAFEHDIGGNGQSQPNVPADVWMNGVTGLACSAIGCAPRWQP
jgi:Tol biopolymer transport system component